MGLPDVSHDVQGGVGEEGGEDDNPVGVGNRAEHVRTSGDVRANPFVPRFLYENDVRYWNGRVQVRSRDGCRIEKDMNDSVGLHSVHGGNANIRRGGEERGRSDEIGEGSTAKGRMSASLMTGEKVYMESRRVLNSWSLNIKERRIQEGKGERVFRHAPRWGDASRSKRG